MRCSSSSSCIINLVLLFLWVLKHQWSWCRMCEGIRYVGGWVSGRVRSRRDACTSAAGARRAIRFTYRSHREHYSSRRNTTPRRGDASVATDSTCHEITACKNLISSFGKGKLAIVSVQLHLQLFHLHASRSTVWWWWYQR